MTGKSPELLGVSCPSSELCVAVGRYVYSESYIRIMAGVSYPENGRCNVVGGYRDPTEHIGLMEEWVSGGSPAWTNTTAFKPASETELLIQGDSCPKAKECIAVGHYINEFGFMVTLAEKLKSGAISWGSMTTENPWETDR
jgi:hypothetical protein